MLLQLSLHLWYVYDFSQPLTQKICLKIFIFAKSSLYRSGVASDEDDQQEQEKTHQNSFHWFALTMVGQVKLEGSNVALINSDLAKEVRGAAAELEPVSIKQL